MVSAASSLTVPISTMRPSRMPTSAGRRRRARPVDDGTALDHAIEHRATPLRNRTCSILRHEAPPNKLSHAVRCRGCVWRRGGPRGGRLGPRPGRRRSCAAAARRSAFWILRCSSRRARSGSSSPFLRGTCGTRPKLGSSVSPESSSAWGNFGQGETLVGIEDLAHRVAARGIGYRVPRNHQAGELDAVFLDHAGQDLLEILDAGVVAAIAEGVDRWRRSPGS